MDSMGEKSKGRVLLVDDNPKNIQVAANILSNQGLQVEYSTSGTEAIEWLDNEYFDVILLDIMMPEMDGFEVCRKIKENPKTKDIPVIFLSAKNGMENITKGFQLGGADYITKPFQSEELLARIKTQVEMKKNRENLANVNKRLQQQVAEKTQELQKAYNEMKNIDKIKSSSLMMLSEEIKAPLNGLTGTVNLMKNEEHSFQVKDMLNLLEVSLSRLDHFAQKAVLSSKLSMQQYELHHTEVELMELFRFASIELQYALQDKEIEVLLPETTSNIGLYGDRDLLYKAVLYLFENAIQHSPQKGEIELNSILVNHKGIFSITDEGLGNPDIDRTLALKTFQSGQVRKEERMDINLFVVKQILDLHQGSIQIKNTDNGGAQIILEFNI